MHPIPCPLLLSYDGVVRAITIYILVRPNPIYSAVSFISFFVMPRISAPIAL